MSLWNLIILLEGNGSGCQIKEPLEPLHTDTVRNGSKCQLKDPLEPPHIIGNGFGSQLNSGV